MFMMTVKSLSRMILISLSDMCNIKFLTLISYNNNTYIVYKMYVDEWVIIKTNLK